MTSKTKKGVYMLKVYGTLNGGIVNGRLTYNFDRGICFVSSFINQNRRHTPGMKTRNVTAYPQRRSAKEVWQLILIFSLCSTSQHWNSPPDTNTTSQLLWGPLPGECINSVVAHTVSHVTRGARRGGVVSASLSAPVSRYTLSRRFALGGGHSAFGC